MSSALDSLRDWVRRTTGHAELVNESPGTQAQACEPTADPLAYRLRQWPVLPDALKRAPVYRLLSVMSSRPVNRQWMLARPGLSAADIDALLRWLREGGVLEVIDTSAFRRPH